MAHILNKKFTFRELFVSPLEMKQGGKLPDPKSDREAIEKITEEVGIAASKHYKDKSKSGIKYKYYHLGTHTNELIKYFKDKYPNAQVTGDNMWVTIKVPNENKDAKEHMKDGGIVEANKLKVGMEGVDYGDEKGTIVAIAKVKDFDKIKEYDESGAMESGIEEGEEYGIKPDDILVAVELGEGQHAVYIYGYDGFTVEEKKLKKDVKKRMEEGDVIRRMPLKEYENKVAQGLLSKFDAKTRKYAGVDKKSMLHMIKGHVNAYREFEPNYPDHFTQTVDEMWENDESIEKAIEYFYNEGVKALVMGTLKAM